MKETASRKEHIKFILDILEDIMTILVSLGAIWGAVMAFESGFVHKVKRLVDHYHDNIVAEEQHLKQDLPLRETLNDLTAEESTLKQEVDKESQSAASIARSASAHAQADKAQESADSVRERADAARIRADKKRAHADTVLEQADQQREQAEQASERTDALLEENLNKDTDPLPK